MLNVKGNVLSRRCGVRFPATELNLIKQIKKTMEKAVEFLTEIQQKRAERDEQIVAMLTFYKGEYPEATKHALCRATAKKMNRRDVTVHVVRWVYDRDFIPQKTTQP